MLLDLSANLKRRLDRELFRPEVQPGDTRGSIRGLQGFPAKCGLARPYLDLKIFRQIPPTEEIWKWTNVQTSHLTCPSSSSPVCPQTQASCPLRNPVRWGPLPGGFFRELLCEWQCDEAGDGLDAGPAAGLLHQLAAVVAGRSAALCRQGLEGESVLR